MKVIEKQKEWKISRELEFEEFFEVAMLIDKLNYIPGIIEPIEIKTTVAKQNRAIFDVTSYNEHDCQLVEEFFTDNNY